MATLKITAPDGKVLKIDVTSVDPANYDSVVDEVVADYMSSQGPKLQGDLTPSTENADVTNQGTETKSSIPSLVTGMGRMVEAGGAGIADIVTGKELPQATETIKAVEEEEPVKTTSGKVGKFVGSFFTPAQIAMQAAGGPLAKGVMQGLGKAATGVGKLIARPTEAALPAAQKGASEVIGALTSAEPEALQQVMVQGRKAIKGAASFPQLGEQMATNMTKLETHITDLNKAVEGTLDAKKMLSSQPIVDAIQQAKQLAGTTGSAESEAVVSNLNKLQENIIKKYGDKMSEVDVHKWIQSIQNETRFPGATATESAMNEAKKKAGGMVNDLLKAQNPAYAEAKAPLAEAIGLRDGLAKAMGVEKEAGKAWSAKDVAAGKLRQLLNPENRATTVKMLKELAKVPGMQDVLAQVERTAAKESIEAPAKGFSKLLGMGTRLPELGGIMAGLVPSVPSLATTAASKVAKYGPAGINVARQLYQGLKD
jgi:hypothetical protein